MIMASLNVPMPDELRSFIDEQVRTGGFAGPVEYVRSLIRADRERVARSSADAERVALLLDQLERSTRTGDIASGDPDDLMAPDEAGRVRARLIALAQEGLDSGIAGPMTPDTLDQLRRRALDQAERTPET